MFVSKLQKANLMNNGQLCLMYSYSNECAWYNLINLDESGTGHNARKTKIYATSDTFSKRRFLTINYRMSVKSAIFQTRHDTN